jgi:hypothetical protein
VGLDELGRRIAAAPSRQGMTRPRPKADFLEHVWRFYNAAWRWGHKQRSAHFDATWAQLQEACRYPAEAQVLTSMQSYAAILEEIGLMKVYGVTDANGAWQRLDVELLEPPPVSTPVELQGPGRQRVAEAPWWGARYLTARDRRRLRGLPRAGRRARGRCPRVFRYERNLDTPWCLVKGFALTQTAGAVPGRAHVREPGLEGGTRDPAPGDATGGGFAAGGCAGAAAPIGRTAGIDGAGRDRLLSAFIRAGFHGGADAVIDAAAAAVRDGAGHVAIVTAAWRALRGPSRPRLTDGRGEQLRRGLAMLDRYAGFGAGESGAGVRLVVERIAAELESGAGERLESLNGVAAWAYSVGRDWRRTAKGRQPGVSAPPKVRRPRPRPRPGCWGWPEW